MTLPISAKQLIPQQYPFQMVDTLEKSDGSSIRTSFTIENDNVLLNDQYLSAGGLIENMAQSAAAGTGYFFTSNGKEVPVGYIGAVKNVSIGKLPYVGQTIQTELNTLHQVGNATIVSGKIFLANEVIASCELTIFVAA